MPLEGIYSILKIKYIFKTQDSKWKWCESIHNNDKYIFKKPP